MPSVNNVYAYHRKYNSIISTRKWILEKKYHLKQKFLPNYNINLPSLLRNLCTSFTIPIFLVSVEIVASISLIVVVKNFIKNMIMINNF